MDSNYTSNYTMVAGWHVPTSLISVNGDLITIDAEHVFMSDGVVGSVPGRVVTLPKWFVGSEERAAANIADARCNALGITDLAAIVTASERESLLATAVQ